MNTIQAIPFKDKNMFTRNWNKHSGDHVTNGYVATPQGYVTIKDIKSEAGCDSCTLSIIYNGAIVEKTFDKSCFLDEQMILLAKSFAADTDKDSPKKVNMTPREAIEQIYLEKNSDKDPHILFGEIYPLSYQQLIGLASQSN